MVSVVVISKHFLLEVAFLEELRSFLFVFKGENRKMLVINKIKKRTL